MPRYRVTWEIDIEADTALDAALEARACQRPNSTALEFTVVNSETQTEEIIDLWGDHHDSNTSAQH